MEEIIFLELDEILAIHFDQISRYGGLQGVRDFDLLLSSVLRMRASFGGNDLYPDIFQKAAVLIHSLVLNHPFADGNKRTAVVSCARFLFVNKYHLKVSNTELISLPLDIANKKVGIDGISLWLKKHSRKI